MTIRQWDPREELRRGLEESVRLGGRTVLELSLIHI